jgi:hypothetical protein
MPSADASLKADIIEKLTSKYEWKEMRVILTQDGLYFAKPNEEVLRDMIPLMEIVKLRRARLIPGQDQARADIASLQPLTSLRNTSGTDPSENREEPVVCALQILTAAGGYNSGRSYYLNLGTAAARNDWLQAVRAARRESARRASPNAARALQRRLRVLYRSPPLQAAIAALIFACFLANVVQTEFQASTGAFAALELAFAAVFAAELALNLAAHFLWPFLCDPWNVFDACVVVTSLVSLGADSTPAVSPLRLVRTLR